MKSEVKQTQLDDINTAIFEADEDGAYWYSVEGTYNGLLSQSEDIGPFATLEAAEEDAQDYLSRVNEEEPDYYEE